MKKKFCMLLSVAACACVAVAGGSLYKAPASSVEAAAETSPYQLTMANGASVRLVQNNHGIRFATLLTDAQIQSWAEADENYELGTLFLPKDVYDAFGKELTIDYSCLDYSSGITYNPSASVFSGDLSLLKTNAQFPGYKLFNAVLDMSKWHSDNLKREIVARSYVTIDGVTYYADPVVRSAAYVGAAELNSIGQSGYDKLDTEEQDVLTSYVQHLESVSLGESKYVNAKAGEPLSLPAMVTPASVGYPVKYTTVGNTVSINGSTVTPNEVGTTTVTASVALKVQDTVTVSVLADQAIERKYYKEEDVYEVQTSYQYGTDGTYSSSGATTYLEHRNSTTDYVEFTAYNVDEVYYNGKMLVYGSDYVVDEATISVKAALLCDTAMRENVLKFVSAASGDVELTIAMYYEDEGLLSESLKSYLNSGLQYNPYAYYSVRDAETTVAEKTEQGWLVPTNTANANKATVGTATQTSSYTTSANEDRNFYTEEYIGDYYGAGLNWALGQSSAGISGFLSQLATTNESYDATDTLDKYVPTAENPTLYKTQLQNRALDLYNTLETAEGLGETNSVIVTDGVLNDTDRLTIEKYHKVVKDADGNVTFDPEISTSNDLTKANWDEKAPTFINKNVSGSVFNTRQFKSFDHLVAFYTPYVLRYALHPAFGGLLLRDEPSALYMNLVGQTYKAVKKIYENIEHGVYTYLNPNDSSQTIIEADLPKGSWEHFKAADKQIIVNLLPFYPNSTGSFLGGDNSTDAGKYEMYKGYLDRWFYSSGADYVQADIYSLYQAGIYRYHVVNLQMMAEVAKGYNAKIVVVNSAWRRHSRSISVSTTTLGNYEIIRETENTFSGERIHEYADLEWMNNLTMMYGASNFAYYTYHTLNDNSDQIVEDGASMVTRDGKKTTIYDYVREINAKAQVLAPVILNFDYVQSQFINTFTTDASHYSKLTDYASSSSYVNGSFAKLNGATATDNTHSWLINELYDEDEKDKDKGNYMYAVMNVIDSLKGAADYNAAKSITLSFASEYDYAWVYRDGKFTVQQLTNGTLELTGLTAGQACYVIPFKTDIQTDYIVDVDPNWSSAWKD